MPPVSLPSLFCDCIVAKSTVAPSADSPPAKPVSLSPTSPFVTSFHAAPESSERQRPWSDAAKIVFPALAPLPTMWNAFIAPPTPFACCHVRPPSALFHAALPVPRMSSAESTGLIAIVTIASPPHGWGSTTLVHVMP